MPRSMSGTTRCNTQPTPRPIAIHTPVLTNAMIRNRSREYTALSSSRGQPLIMVMKPPHFRPRDYPPGFRWLDSSGVWAIHLKGKMGAKSVIVSDICREHPLEMPVVEDNDMIEYVATDTSNEPLAVGILPGTARGNFDFFDAHVLDVLLKMLTVDRVAVSQQVTWGRIPGKRLNDLLDGPLRRWMFGDVEMDDASALVRQQDEHKQDLEAGSGNGKEVTRHKVFDMIMEKGLPRG